ncbi:MAG: hypothetical protein K0S65_2381 [Labilithrix sp.]|nr:hypothetical protein [Labilithrix sp.]
MQRASIVAGAVLVTSSTFLWAACDDAILGVRVLRCDGSVCNETEEPETSRPDGGGCSPIDPPECEAGVPVPRREGDCVVGYTCTATCASLGGECKTRAACSGGRWSADASVECTGGVDLGCCRACPAIAAPPPGYCDGGTVTEVYEGDCRVGFACE